MRAFVPAIGLLLCAGLAFAQTGGDAPVAAAPDAATDKTEAKNKTGAGKRPPSEKQLAQRAKMKRCNADAKQRQLKGDVRKLFMRGCLSNRPIDAQSGAAVQ